MQCQPGVQLICQPSRFANTPNMEQVVGQCVSCTGYHFFPGSTHGGTRGLPWVCAGQLEVFWLDDGQQSNALVAMLRWVGSGERQADVDRMDLGAMLGHMRFVRVQQVGQREAVGTIGPAQMGLHVPQHRVRRERG